MGSMVPISLLANITEIGKLAHEKGIYFHTDAVQAMGHVPIDVEEMHIDLLSISGHKLGAPKGIGAIYIRKGVRITPLIFAYVSGIHKMIITFALYSINHSS